MYIHEGYCVPLTSLLSNEALHDSIVTTSEKVQGCKSPCTDLASQHLIHALMQLWVTTNHPQFKKQPAVLNAFQQALNTLLLDCRNTIEAAQQTAPSANSHLPQLKQLMQQVNTLSNSMWALNPLQPIKQVNEFLVAALPLKGNAFNTLQGRVVGHPSMVHRGFPKHLISEQLNPLYYNQLTQWFEALQQTLQHQATQLLTNTSALPSSNRVQLAAHVLGIRFFGSGYYMYIATQWLVEEAPSETYTMEASLFQALNYFDTLTPQALRLHQNFNALHPNLVGMNEAELTPLLKQVEAHTESSPVANSKELAHAIALQEKFHHGILPSTLQQHDTTELWEKMNTLGLTQESKEATDYDALHEQQAIYQLLPHINESPVTERDIILAAWLYRFDTANEFIQHALEAMKPLNEMGTNTESWNRFCNHQHASELRTIKALETSRLHRMLFVPSASLPLGVESGALSNTPLV
jgi:hypothetical protein